MKISSFLTALCLAVSANFSYGETQTVSIPTENSLKTELAEAQKLDDGEVKTALIADVEGAITLLKTIKEQQQTNDNLMSTLRAADNEIQKNNAQLQILKKQMDNIRPEDYQSLSSEALQSTLTSLLAQQQETQSQLSSAGSLLAEQSAISERAQGVLADNLKRSQDIAQQLNDKSTTTARMQKYQLELQLLELKTSYNQTLLKNSDQLSSLYKSRYELLNARSQLLQQQITAIQEVINQHNLQQSKEQVEQAQQQQQSAVKNSYIQQELERNAKLSQYLLQQTEKANILTQDELRMRNVLDNLTQTQRTIDEQISALQGTLVLSRIVQLQKQKLPTNLNIDGLSKQIADLRVQIFDITQDRDELYDLDAYIAALQQTENQEFTAAEKTQLTTLLTERRKIDTDLIKLLNNQLNLLINLELTQQQITQISDQIQAKLDQQSFWVRSNNPIDLNWFKALPNSLMMQIGNIGKKLGFKTNDENLPILFTICALLVGIGFIISRFKNRIKQRLSLINEELNKLRADTQWHTPQALLLTAILALPTTLWFLALCQLIGFFFFRNPIAFWEWSFEMAGYWWFFNFALALLRPNGIMIKHFGFTPENVGHIRTVTRRIIVAIVLLLNTSIFSNVMERGLANDVLGEINTISALVFCIFIILPLFNKMVIGYNQSAPLANDKLLLNVVRLTLLFMPIMLIILIILGYYYTSLNLIKHAISTYIAWVVWTLIRQIIYRAITVSSRRLAYRRLQEKRAQRKTEQNDEASDDVVVSSDSQEEGLALNDVRNQLLRFADLFIWTALFAIFYYVWSDLITVANYLKNVALWQQTTVTDAGTVTETITLFNLLVALVIVSITYILIRNIAGMLEILLFSRVKLSQGTPYTITTLLTYALIAIGGAWAFATLGMSWSKLQWLFAALSVGLGFGMQEIFANFVSGLILLFERPIRVGDTVTINGISGTVAKIRIRAITIIDFDRKEVIVPNKAFVTGQVTNWALSNTITRLVITVGVAYGSDLDLVRKLLLQAAAEQDSVLKEPEPRALFLSFGASTLDHELRVYVGQVSERTNTVDALNRRINELFATHNIDIAFNQLDVFIKNQDNGAEMPLIEVKASQ